VEIELRQIFERGLPARREDQVIRLIEIACSDRIIFRGRVRSRDLFSVLSATAMTAPSFIRSRGRSKTSPFSDRVFGEAERIATSRRASPR